MLYSFQSALEQDIPLDAKKHIRAAQIFGGAEGFVLGPQALQSFLSNTHAGADIPSLIEHAQDAESTSRVDNQIRARMVTDKIPDDVAQHIVEAVEVLGIHSTSMQSADVPIVCVLYTSAQVNQTPIIINVVGKKALADAIRELWARVFVSPYPPMDVKTAIVMYRMPPIEQCVHVITTDKTHLYAVHGWGLAVGDDEISDTYILGPDQSSFIEHHVRTQDFSVYRNARTGEVVRSRPAQSSIQKVSDDQLRRIASLSRRAQIPGAYIGVFGEHLRVLRVMESDEESSALAGEDVSQEGYAQRAPDPDPSLDELVDPPHDEQEPFEQVPAEQETAHEEPVEHPSAQELLADAHEEQEPHEYLAPVDIAHVHEQQAPEPQEGNHAEHEPAPLEPEYHEPPAQPPSDDLFEQAVHEVEHSAEQAVEEIEDAVEELAQTLAQAQQDVEQEEVELDDIIEDAHEHTQALQEESDVPPFEELDESRYDPEPEETHEEYEESLNVEQEEVEQEETADSVYQETIELAGHVIDYTLFTIELALKEYMGADAPADFADLVHAVANKREVPRMNRIIALHDMRVDGSSARPSPENVRLALDTLELFRKEFE